MEKEQYECVIIGAGPGGLQAAIHLGRYNRKVLLIDQGGGRTRHALHMENYLGLPSTSGKELIDTGIAQARSFGVECRTEKVISLVRENGFVVGTDKGQYRTPYVIASSGARENLPAIKGLNRFFARTVFTCVVCDGYRTSGRKLAILGDSLEAVRLVLGMKEMFTRDITLVLPPGLLPADQAELLAEEGIPFVAGVAEEFFGDPALAGVRCADGREIPCEVAMLSYGYSLNDGYLAELAPARDSNGVKIMTDALCETSVKNLFALGALRPGNAQAIIAAGQGAVVAMEINNRLLVI